MGELPVVYDGQGNILETGKEQDEPAPVDATTISWLIVISAGLRRISGDDWPKQFCAVVVCETRLIRLWAESGESSESEHTALDSTKAHERFYSNLASDAGGSQVLVQPHNRGTAPAIMYSLSRFRELDPTESCDLSI